jgi:hypothetical protein
VVFADQVFAIEHHNQPAYSDWASFEKELWSQFLLPHEHIHAMNTLELIVYHQAKGTIDKYINDLETLIEQVGYSNGLAIVMKFQEGLDPSMQSCIANIVEGRLPDDQPTPPQLTLLLFPRLTLIPFSRPPLPPTFPPTFHPVEPTVTH